MNTRVKGTCSVDSCDRPRNSHGLCRLHARRLRVHGDVEQVSVIRGDDLSRFMSKVDTENGPTFDEELGPCWQWQARLDPKSGYAPFRLKRRYVAAHRWIYWLWFGPIGPGLVVDHLCRNRACVNPFHLEAVTTGENVRRGHAARKIKSVCWQGHPLSETEACITCRRQRARINHGNARPDDLDYLQEQERRLSDRLAFVRSQIERVTEAAA